MLKAEYCGDCRLPQVDACKCAEHLRICEEQQRAERAEEEVARLKAERFLAGGRSPAQRRNT